MLHLLLEADGPETGVESTNTLGLEDLGEAANEAVGVGGLGDETDTSSLEGAECDVGEELGSGRRAEVDGGAVVGRVLIAEVVDRLLLEELVTSELEGTLEEVAGKCRADTGEERASTLALDNLAEAADHAIVVGDGVELDTGLDAVVDVLATIKGQRGDTGPELGGIMSVSVSGVGAEKERDGRATYTSTGVRAPWVMEQQRAPARANLE